jgi:hypothetical protein
MATAAKDTRGRNGIMIRVRRTVSSLFPGSSAKPGTRPATMRPAKRIPRSTGPASTTATNVSTRLARRNAASRPPSFIART